MRSGRYSGFPFGAHFDVPGIQKEHFGDWLALFEEALAGVYQEDMVRSIMAMADQFAQRFSGALFASEFSVRSSSRRA